MAEWNERRAERVDFHVHPVDNTSTVVEHTGYAKSGTPVVWARDATRREDGS